MPNHNFCINFHQRVSRTVSKMKVLMKISITNLFKLKIVRHFTEWKECIRYTLKIQLWASKVGFNWILPQFWVNGFKKSGRITCWTSQFSVKMQDINWKHHQLMLTICLVYGIANVSHSSLLILKMMILMGTCFHPKRRYNWLEWFQFVFDTGSLIQNTLSLFLSVIFVM